MLLKGVVEVSLNVGVTFVALLIVLKVAGSVFKNWKIHNRVESFLKPIICMLAELVKFFGGFFLHKHS